MLASSSSSSSTSSCRPVVLGSLGVRRPRRVLYPASRSRRLPMREAPDQALRWLLLLSALVFLQIYTEEANTCTDFQSQCPDQAATQSRVSESSLGTAQGWTGEESWRVEIVAGPADAQLECVVS